MTWPVRMMGEARHGIFFVGYADPGNRRRPAEGFPAR